MRSGYLLAAVLFCICARPSLRLQAQLTEPTKEELQMTEDPKWPGAYAVALNVDEYTNDVKHTKMYYRRIKVLTEKGKDLATVRMAFLRGGSTLAGFEGRTIHPDGTIATLSEPPSEFTELKIKRLEIASLVFTLPSVTVGSILEYRVKFVLPKKEISAPSWELQHEYPVRKARYSFLAKKLDFDTGGYFLQYDGRIPKTANVLGDLKTSYLLELTDIPPLPDEDWMAPVNSISWRVQFYYSDGVTGRGVWDHVRAQWADYVKAVVEPTKDMKKIAAGLVAASDSNEQKAKKNLRGGSTAGQHRFQPREVEDRTESVKGAGAQDSRRCLVSEEWIPRSARPALCLAGACRWARRLCGAGCKSRQGSL